MSKQMKITLTEEQFNLLHDLVVSQIEIFEDCSENPYLDSSQLPVYKEILLTLETVKQITK